MLTQFRAETARERDELRADSAGASRTSRTRRRHLSATNSPALATRPPKTARPARQPRGSALAARPGNRGRHTSKKAPAAGESAPPGPSHASRARVPTGWLPSPPLDPPVAACARRGVARPREGLEWSALQPPARWPPGPGYSALAARSTIFAACPAPALSTIRDLGRARSAGVSRRTPEWPAPR